MSQLLFKFVFLFINFLMCRGHHTLHLLLTHIMPHTLMYIYSKRYNQSYYDMQVFMCQYEKEHVNLTCYDIYIYM